MKVQAGTPMTEVIKQYAELSGIDEAECRFLVGGKPLKTDKPSRARVPRAARRAVPRARGAPRRGREPGPPCAPPRGPDPSCRPRRLDEQVALTNRDQAPVVDDDDGFDCSSCSCMPNMN